MSNGSQHPDGQSGRLSPGLMSLATLPAQAREAVRDAVIVLLRADGDEEPEMPSPMEVAEATGANVWDVSQGASAAISVAQYVLTQGESLDDLYEILGGQVDLEEDAFGEVMDLLRSIVEALPAEQLKEKAARDQAVVRGLRSLSRVETTADLRLVKVGDDDSSQLTKVPVGIITILCSIYGTGPEEFTFQLSRKQLSQLVETLSELSDQLDYLEQVELPRDLKVEGPAEGAGDSAL